MISGFLTSVISLPTTSKIPRNALRWLLISTIFYSGFFSSEAFDKRTNRVSTDVADKHARYVRLLLSPGEVEKVTNELGDNGAHRCVDYCFCKRTAIISASEGTPLQTQDCPWCSGCSLCHRKWRPTGRASSRIHRSHLMRFALFKLGIRSITDRTNPGHCV